MGGYLNLEVEPGRGVGLVGGLLDGDRGVKKDVAQPETAVELPFSSVSKES